MAGLILAVLSKGELVWGWGCPCQDYFCLKSALEVQVTLILSQD